MIVHVDAGTLEITKILERTRRNDVYEGTSAIGERETEREKEKERRKKKAEEKNTVS